MATGLGAEDSPDLERQVGEIIEFENMLNEVEVCDSSRLRVFSRHFPFFSRSSCRKSSPSSGECMNRTSRTRRAGTKKRPNYKSITNMWVDCKISFHFVPFNNIFCLDAVHGLVVAIHPERYVEGIRQRQHRLQRPISKVSWRNSQKVRKCWWWCLNYRQEKLTLGLFSKNMLQYLFNQHSYQSFEAYWAILNFVIEKIAGFDFR